MRFWAPPLAAARARPLFNEPVFVAGYVPADKLPDPRSYPVTPSYLAGNTNALIVSEGIASTCLPTNLLYPEMSGAPVLNVQDEAAGILSERVVETRTGTVTLVFAAALNP